MTTEVSNVRKPWVASSLSLLCTGLGQIYCGRVGRGLVMYSGSLLFGPVIVATAVLANSTGMLIAFLASLTGLIGLIIWSVRDAAAIARSQAAATYQPQEFNRPIVYTMLAATSVPYALGLAFLLRATVFEAFIIPSASMSPTLVPGDRILVTKVGIASQTLERGDLVVFRNPVNRRQTYVKRIIGLPGDKVEIKNGDVIVNEQPLQRTPDSDDKRADQGQGFIERAGDRQYRILIDKPEVPMELPPLTVADDAYFVLGDHRDLSFDSRKIGSIPHGLVVGVVKYIYYPADKWERFGVAN